MKQIAKTKVVTSRYELSCFFLGRAKLQLKNETSSDKDVMIMMSRHKKFRM